MMANGPPQLSFACELDPARLVELFADGSVIEHLQALRARLLIMVSDLSDEPVRAVRRLNEAGIPLVGIPLFPEREVFGVDGDRVRDRGPQQLGV